MTDLTVDDPNGMFDNFFKRRAEEMSYKPMFYEMFDKETCKQLNAYFNKKLKKALKKERKKQKKQRKKQFRKLILKLLVSGMTVEEIATRLDIPREKIRKIILS